MSKGVKLFSLDLELIEEIKKENNQSLLVNELLRSYFSQRGKLERSRIETKIDDLKKAQPEINELRERLREMDKKEEAVDKILSRIPRNIQEDFKMFPNITIEALKNRYEELYKRKNKGLTWPALLHAWKKGYRGESENETVL